MSFRQSLSEGVVVGIVRIRIPPTLVIIPSTTESMGGSSCDERTPPLKVVLGAFGGGSSKSEPSSTTLAAATEAAGGEGSPSPVAYILGTSYFATPRLLGANTSGVNRRSSVLRLNKDGRVPMEDRKGPFDHFRPKSLVLSVSFRVFFRRDDRASIRGSRRMHYLSRSHTTSSPRVPTPPPPPHRKINDDVPSGKKTVRVTAINISTTLSNYFSDQLCFEQKIEEMVDSGYMTPAEADDKNEEWESSEWRLRMDLLPKKIGFALIRYHACTALMRFYEYVAARHVLRVADGGGDASAHSARSSSGGGGGGDPSCNFYSQERAIDIMDRLTRDPFQASLRTSQILRKREHANGRVISSTDGSEIPTSRELARRMFSTCMWANVIPFLAELTVQQGVLIYGYGAYYMAKHRKRKKRESSSTEKEEEAGGGGGGSKECDDEGEGEEEEEDKHDEKAYALSLYFRSCHLTVARSASWLVASAGGAAGSVVLPGWGTVFGIQIGDAVAGALFD